MAIPSKSGSPALLNTVQCFHQSEATPWPRTLHNAFHDNLKFFVSRYPIALPVHISFTSVSEDETVWSHLRGFLNFLNMKFECSSNKPVISCKELSNPKNPEVLEDLLTSTVSPRFFGLQFIGLSILQSMSGVRTIVRCSCVCPEWQLWPFGSSCGRKRRWRY